MLMTMDMTDLVVMRRLRNRSDVDAIQSMSSVCEVPWRSVRKAIQKHA